jgi:hypothetical protein
MASQPKTGREQALAVMEDYKNEKMSFYSCLERLGDIESDEFFGDDELDEEPYHIQMEKMAEKDKNDNEAGSAALGCVGLVFSFILVFMLLALIGSHMEDSTHKLTCNAATKQVDGSFASNCDSYGEYYDSGAP